MSGTASQPLPRGTRWRRLRLFVLLSVLAILLAGVGVDMMAGYRLNAALARVEQRVGPLSVERLSAPEVPAADNRARLVRAAAALTVPPSREDTAAIMALGGAGELGPIPDVVRAFVAANQPAVTLSNEFATRPKADWAVDYFTGENMPSLLEIRTLGDLLMVSALIELESGRLDAAARHVANGLAVSASMRQEPNLITQLIRVAVAGRQIGAVQRLVMQPSLSRAALEALAERLAENREPPPMTVAMTGELVLINSRFAAAEAGRADESIAVGPRVLRSNRLLARIGRPFLRMQRVAYLHRMEAIIDSQLGPRPRHAVPAEGGSFLARQFMPGVTAGLTRALVTGDDHDSQLAAAETAVALRRYKLDRGEYPADLGALAPVYLPAIPIDPYTGQPPAYAREGAGFTLTTRRSDPRLSSLRPTPEWTVR